MDISCRHQCVNNSESSFAPSAPPDTHYPLVSCSRYLCPDTHLCVESPSACPCPNVEDVKCLVPDAIDRNGATILCVRGADECAEVTRLMKRFK